MCIHRLETHLGDTTHNIIVVDNEARAVFVIRIAGRETLVTAAPRGKLLLGVQPDPAGQVQVGGLQ